MKILKHKKIIAFLLVFTLSFLVVTDYKQKETHAIAIVDDIFFWTVGALLIATTGVAINSVSQTELGRIFTNKWISSGNKKEELLVRGIGGVVKGLYITTKLKEFIKTFSIPSTVPVINNNDVDVISGLSSYNGTYIDSKNKYLDSSISSYYPKYYKFTIKVPSNVSKLQFTVGNKKILVADISNYKIYNNTIRFGVKSINGGFGGPWGAEYYFYNDVNIKLGTSLFTGFDDSNELWYSRFYNIIGLTSTGESVELTFSEPKDYEIKTIDSSTIDKTLVQDVPDKGYLPLPTDQVIENSKDTSLPVDQVKDHIHSIPLEGESDNVGVLLPDGSLELDNTKEWDIPKDDVGDNVGDNTGDIVGDIDDIFDNTIKNKIDFSPLYMSFADKFPFCLPFDFYNIINQFKSTQKEPVFYVDMSGFSSDKTRSNLGFEIDLTKFDILFKVCRTFTLISFSVFLMLKTRDIIKG